MNVLPNYVYLNSYRMDFSYRNCFLIFVSKFWKYQDIQSFILIFGFKTKVATIL